MGDEAVARAAIDAGIGAAYAYPGTPSTEIFLSIEHHVKLHRLPVRGMWSSNEKVALEQAAGASYAGVRVLVAMKHVGLNVAADPFMNLAVSGAHGGLVVVVADDPSMHSSQNEQDSRYFADFAQVPCLEPANQQQCYDFTREAFELSERLHTPVLLRLVTRLAHSRAQVNLAPPRPAQPLGVTPDARSFTLIPVNARRAYAQLVDKQAQFLAYSETRPANGLTLAGPGRPGIVASGVAINYVREALGERLAGYNLLHITGYPLPVKALRRLMDASTELTVVEEGYPFIERYVSALGLMREPPIKGRLSGALPRMGELSPDALKRCFGIPVRPSIEIKGLDDVLVSRPPRLCDKCPHTDSYEAIREVLAEAGHDVRVMGDIGCYSLGAMAPHQAIHSCLCMGASIGMAMGMAHAGIHPALAVIGDGTFTHSGMPALLDAARDNTPMTVFILDNSIIAMTGGQPTLATDEDVADLVAGLGVPRAHIRIVVPSPHKKEHTQAVIREELAYHGLSVIVARRACVTYAKEIKHFKQEHSQHAHLADTV
ncbi:MAG: thiamine pyrophosphate-dependent enzyme [Rhodoferax sp.]